MTGGLNLNSWKQASANASASAGTNIVQQAQQTAQQEVIKEDNPKIIEWCTKWYKDTSTNILIGYISSMGETKCFTRLIEVLNSSVVKDNKNYWAKHFSLVDVMHVVLQYDLIPEKEVCVVIRKEKIGDNKYIEILSAEITYEGLITLASRRRPEMVISTKIWTKSDYELFQIKHKRVPNGTDVKDAPCETADDISRNTLNLFEMPTKLPLRIQDLKPTTIGLIQVIWTNRETGAQIGEMFPIGYLQERMLNVKACQNKTNVWKTDENAMWVKTAIKQFLKLKVMDLGLPFELLHTPDERI